MSLLRACLQFLAERKSHDEMTKSQGKRREGFAFSLRANIGPAPLLTSVMGTSFQFAGMHAQLEISAYEGYTSQLGISRAVITLYAHLHHGLYLSCRHCPHILIHLAGNKRSSVPSWNRVEIVCALPRTGSEFRWMVSKRKRTL